MPSFSATRSFKRTEGPAVSRRIAIEDILEDLGPDEREESCCRLEWMFIQKAILWIRRTDVED